MHMQSVMNCWRTYYGMHVILLLLAHRPQAVFIVTYNCTAATLLKIVCCVDTLLVCLYRYLNLTRQMCVSQHSVWCHWTNIEISYMFCFQNVTFPHISYT